MKLNEKENHRPPFSYVPERLKPFLATAYYLTQIVGMIAAAVMGWKILFSNSTSSKPANSPGGSSSTSPDRPPNPKEPEVVYQTPKPVGPAPPAPEIAVLNPKPPEIITYPQVQGSFLPRRDPSVGQVVGPGAPSGPANIFLPPPPPSLELYPNFSERRIGRPAASRKTCRFIQGRSRQSGSLRCVSTDLDGSSRSESFKIDDEDEDAYPFECIQQGIQSCKKNWMNKRVFKPSRN